MHRVKTLTWDTSITHSASLKATIHRLAPLIAPHKQRMTRATLQQTVRIRLVSSSMHMCFLSMVYLKVSTVRSTTRLGVPLTLRTTGSIVALIGTLYHALTATL